MLANIEERPAERPLADDELLIVRRFEAPRALVFRMWSVREHMMRWMGPPGFTCTVFDMDFRPGGAWRGCIVSEEQGENWMGGTYREIEADRKIVYSFAWGHSDPPFETVVTVTFDDDGAGTVQSFHQTGFLTAASRDNHVGGWNGSFDREQTYAETLTQGEAS
jgi:uncharacterized protein YndB with AHSA1/START domain